MLNSEDTLLSRPEGIPVEQGTSTSSVLLQTRAVDNPALNTRFLPPKQNRLGWGTLRRLAWATRPDTIFYHLIQHENWVARHIRGKNYYLLVRLFSEGHRCREQKTLDKDSVDWRTRELMSFDRDRTGRRVPHPRHWQALAELVGFSADV